MESSVVNYIRQARASGLADGEIKKNLLNAGWEAQAVEEGFTFVRALENKAALSPDAASDMAEPISRSQAAVEPEEHGQMETPAEPEAAGRPAGQRAVAIQPAEEARQNAAAQPAPSQQTTQIQAGTRSSGTSLGKKIAVLGIVAVLAGGAAYAYKTHGSPNPNAVWQKFSQSQSDATYQTRFYYNYFDPASFTEAGGFGISLNGLKLELQGTSYSDSSSAGNAKSSSTMQYSFANGSSSAASSLEFRLLDKTLYVNLSGNPALQKMLAPLTSATDTSVNWIKIDFGQIGAAGAASSSAQLQRGAAPLFGGGLSGFWQNLRFIQQGQYLGSESVNGVRTLHYKNSPDKQALKSAAERYATQLAVAYAKNNQPPSSQNISLLTKIADMLVDKLDIKQLETWVGASDFKLYRLRLVSSAPSVVSLIKNLSSLPIDSVADTKRLADVQGVGLALSLYAADNGGYPEGTGGVPQNLQPDYLQIIPAAPNPPGGNCTGYYNTYWYVPAGAKSTVRGKTVYSSYELTFCLGSGAGGLKPGIARLTPAGIADAIACPSTPDNCFNAAAAAQTQTDGWQKALDFASNLDFSAEFSANVEYSKFGQTQDVQAPASSVDLLQSPRASSTPPAN